MSTENIPRGTVAAGYESVREEFAAVAADQGGDYAAQLVAHVGGRRVVDLWVGPEFTGSSLTGVFSSTKGAAYLVVALLVQDGVLDLDQRVSHYWPEFGAEGKQDITLRDLLAHRAGVVGVEGGFSLDELADDLVIAERLAAARPFWRPGTAFGYHALVIGALTGELVRRTTGRTLQEVFEARVRAPYALDFYLGLPEDLEDRFRTTLPMVATPAQLAELEAGATAPDSVTGIAYNQHHPDALAVAELPNQRVVRAKGPASVGGVASARGLAGMYAAAISEVDGRAPLLKPETAAAFAQLHSIGYDVVARMHKAFGLGFTVSAEVYPVLGQGAFGHSGAAGSQAFADPRSGLAYGYNRRRFAFPGGAAPENDRLVRAVHAAVVGQDWGALR
ncbi:CubicO group peptidase, beta-lactamase class C family [Saccharopolyspora kobensis]|uniref:CubicO group peptidase, beta-lactamase class C family n=1 Tax=Saccharopolyspora kobensis TaxID=146035 RepID=A0A1H5XMJ0_9PSEU|nr:serine hydrolase domain-containing protein [Saccharopolyspora kobensis]SEG12994.1 CubicO group peptidase, beta-lactamase class C family [Saccharopolyspora kobensis]SFE40491.1 CubicO group peptidase, beta-lactamase class C family [Saccharopolyspora kobensis]